jgi:hypothetical protein
VGAEVLDVVEDEEELALAQVLAHLVHGLRAAGEAQPQLAREASAELVGRGDALDGHESGAVAIGGAELLARAARKPGLAHAARPDDAKEAALRLREEARDLAQLDRAADEIVARRGGRRREGWSGRAQGVVQRGEVRGGREAQLVREPRRKIAVRGARAAAVPALAEPRHVRAQRRFVERIGFEEARG